MPDNTKLKALKTKLTLLFIAGRRPTTPEMIKVERLREEIATLEYELRRDVKPQG